MCRVLVDSSTDQIGGTCSVCGGEIIPVRIVSQGPIVEAKSRYGPGSKSWDEFVERMRQHDENMKYYARRWKEQWWTTDVGL